MFTGIVEAIGKVVKIEKEKGNIHFTIDQYLNIYGFGYISAKTMF